MRFKVDENLHDDIAAFLSGQGHDAHTVHAETMRGSNDAALVERCRIEQRVLVTLDLDFADIRAYPPADYAGFIVLRLSNQSRRHVLTVLPRVLKLLEHEPVAAHLWIVTDHNVRIRGG